MDDRSHSLDYRVRYASARSPVFGRSMAATSQPLASSAAAEMLLAGGNAVDAAVAAAMTLTVVEPTSCGIGSDAFALVWDGSTLHGLDASGRSPGRWAPERFGQGGVPELGWDSVTVPGAVSGWVALAERFGTLPLERLAQPAIRHAGEGYHVTPIIAEQWRRSAKVLAGQPGFTDCFLHAGRAPMPGEHVRLADHADTLASIAATNGESFYRGGLAERIVADAERHGGGLSGDDLADHRSEWVAPLSQSFGHATVHELPPAGQGVGALIGLGILEQLPAVAAGPDDPREVHLAIEATKLALADLAAHIADPAAMMFPPTALLGVGYLAGRAARIDPDRAGDPGHGEPSPGGTVCLSTADANGMMVSYIQSNYMGFGSGVVVPNTGISLQNRGVGFTSKAGHPNQVGPRKRPFHTIIPGFASCADGSPLMAFGLMGGPMQAQGHIQLALRIIRHGQNPQAAADAPRWRVLDGRRVAVEPTMNSTLVDALRALGHDIIIEADESSYGFGGAQLIVRTDRGYVGGSDPRKDGLAIGL